MKTIKEKMNFKNMKPETNEEGFTLIELLIVIVIIGILAAIALPIFLNQQNAALAATAKSDVRNTLSEVGAALVKAPTITDVSLLDFEPTVTEDNVVSVTGAWNNYFIKAYNDAGCYEYSSVTGKTTECETDSNTPEQPAISAPTSFTVAKEGVIGVASAAAFRWTPGAGAENIPHTLTFTGTDGSVVTKAATAGASRIVIATDDAAFKNNVTYTVTISVEGISSSTNLKIRNSLFNGWAVV